jgi:glyoxylase-like metal-dependent hydrolase (beta-lactamase superfamily II)
MREVSVSEFAKAHTAEAAVIDVVEVGEYHRGHVPAVVSLPQQDLALQDLPQQDLALQDLALQDLALQDLALQDLPLGRAHIFETHIHNDYVTGGLALARETGAAYHVNADDPVASMTSPSRSAAGYRASIATSILLARGHRVIAIDDDYTNDDYTNAGAAGLPLTAGDQERNGR